MMRITCVVDKKGTAIDRLAEGVARFHDNIQFDICDVHPKRPSADQLQRFEASANQADIVDFQYFRTAEMLLDRYDWLKDKKKILTHMNPYSIREQNWNHYDYVIANNQSMWEELTTITQAKLKKIQLTVDTDFWQFNPNWKPNKQVIMVAKRIEGKKGILPVAIACGELGFKLIVVGSVSDQNYAESVWQTGAVEFHENISDGDLMELYQTSSLLVCNSIDDFESGPLPVLEAMLCGTPVLSRPVGHVPELNNGLNMEIYDGDPENVLELKRIIGSLLDDESKLRGYREKAWDSAKVRSNERRAYEYQRLYREVMSDEKTVSVIVPCYQPEGLKECLDAIENQSYTNLEIIVSNDNPESHNESLVKGFAARSKYPVRYINRPQEGWGLARARNLGIIEATGDVLVFCDQRQIMYLDAIEQFVANIKPRYWLYGNKGFKKDFVENFSCVYRQECIDAGMFCERMEWYGGMSQEVRSRIRSQGMQTEYIESAKATPKGKSSNRWRRKNEITRSKNRLYKMGLL